MREGDRAVVVDFGMAKIVTGGGGTGTTALTEHNMVFGTPEYMAPEQARGDELDARCDVYAAGIILYELLTGSVPFAGTTPLNVLTAHLTEEPQRPTGRSPDRGISPAMEAVAMHAIAKDPAVRYATAGALAFAVRSAIASPMDVDGVRPASRVHVPIDTTDAHSATLPAPIPLAPLVPMPRRGELAPTPAPPQAEERTSPVWIVVCVLAALAGVLIGAWLSVRSGR